MSNIIILSIHKRHADNILAALEARPHPSAYELALFIIV